MKFWFLLIQTVDLRLSLLPTDNRRWWTYLLPNKATQKPPVKYDRRYVLTLWPRHDKNNVLRLLVLSSAANRNTIYMVKLALSLFQQIGVFTFKGYVYRATILPRLLRYSSDAYTRVVQKRKRQSMLERDENQITSIYTFEPRNQ